jgi:hypothetical protein
MWVRVKFKYITRRGKLLNSIYLQGATARKLSLLLLSDRVSTAYKGGQGAIEHEGLSVQVTCWPYYSSLLSLSLQRAPYLPCNILHQDACPKMGRSHIPTKSSTCPISPSITHPERLSFLKNYQLPPLALELPPPSQWQQLIITHTCSPCRTTNANFPAKLNIAHSSSAQLTLLLSCCFCCLRRLLERGDWRGEGLFRVMCSYLSFWGRGMF